MGEGLNFGCGKEEGVMDGQDMFSLPYLRCLHITS